MVRVLPVILAGGCGSRLRPLSSDVNPKQFLKLGGDNSLVQATFLRLVHKDFAAILGQPIVLTGIAHLARAKKQISKIYSDECQFIVEPMAFNTAPAIAAFVAQQFFGNATGNEVACITPSDHFIKNEKGFRSKLLEAFDVAKDGAIITLGVRTTSAHTGYGYIRPKTKGDKCSQVAQFHEKPDLETARSWFSSDQYLWNSGIIVARLDTLRAAFQTHMPQLWDLAVKSCTAPDKLGDIQLNSTVFRKIKPTSFDISIMEKFSNCKVIPMDVGWSDLGTLSEIYNSVIQTQHLNDQKNYGGFSEGSQGGYNNKNLIIGGQRKLYTVGLDGVLVIDGPKNLIIADSSRLDEIEELQINQPSAVNFSIDNTDKIRNWLNTTLFEWNIPLIDDEAIQPYVEAREAFVFCHATVNLDAQLGKSAAYKWNQLKFPWEPTYDPVTDVRKTYDIAHSLLASAWAFAAFNDDEIKTTGHKILAFLDAKLSDPVYGGYQEVCSIDNLQLQPLPDQRGTNSHMHLLEAFLAWYEITKDAIWIEKATCIVDLFTTKFFIPVIGCAPEYFDLTFAPPDHKKVRVETGHMYEWIWLLCRFQSYSGVNVTSVTRRLYEFAYTWGQNPHSGLVYDAHSGFGEIITSSSRCWPQVERLKALVALNSHGIINDQKIVEQQIELIFSYFLETSQANPWIDKVDEDGNVIDAKPAPSSRYHLYVGFYEYLQTDTSIRISSVAS